MRIYLICILIITTSSMSCTKSDNKMKLSKYFTREESFKMYKGKHDVLFNDYRVRDFTSGKELIVCNFPFKIEGKYDLILLLKNQIVYIKSVGIVKIPKVFAKDDIINFEVGIIKDEIIFLQTSKVTFRYEPEIKYYYLSFYPDNTDNEFSLSVIPSNIKLE